MRIDVAWVRAKVREIEKYAQKGDPEAAHSEEDDLYEEVLKAIAEKRCISPRRCAEAALSTKLSDFPRWCA